MSKIEDIRDAMIAKVETALGAGWRRLPNAYVVEENTYLQLQKGYAVRTDAGLNLELTVTPRCGVMYERIFTVILIRQMTATQNNVTARDGIDQLLQDDIEALHKAFELDHTLGGIAVICTVVGDTGINFIDAERLKFLQTEINLRVQYHFNPSS